MHLIRNKSYEYILLDFEAKQSSGWWDSVADAARNNDGGNVESWYCKHLSHDEITTYLLDDGYTILFDGKGIIADYPELFI